MIRRRLWQKLEQYIDTKQALVITGPRRVGKTTTLNWLLDQTDSKNKAFLDIENLSDRALFEMTDYNDTIAALTKRGLDFSRKAYLAVDEIQFLPNITSVIKYLYDHYDIKFFLSGSSSYYLKNHFNESMAGRKFLFELLPLYFSEYLDFVGAKYALPLYDFKNAPRFNQLAYNDISNFYADYVKYGGYPEVVVAATPELKQAMAAEIYSTYINQDVVTLADFRSTTDLRRLVGLLAARIGNRINTLELSQVSGLSRNTVNAYLEFLEQTYLIATIPVESSSEDVRVRNLRKLYFVDNGIASFNAQLSGGQLFENALRHQLSAYGTLSYFDNGQNEVDFILEENGRKIALEAKTTPTVADQNTLENVASTKLNTQDFALLGEQKTEKFSDYIWGGELG